MTWEDVVRKLTSRKLWVAVCGLVVGVLIACRVDSETAETIGGLIMAGASVIAYIVGEGLVDAAHIGDDVEYEFYDDAPGAVEGNGDE